MTEKTHTPGPWRVSQTYPLGDYCIHAAGIPQQLAYLAESKVKDWPLEANARLIAAAPDMLAALRNVQKLIAEAALTGFNYKDGDWPERLFESQQVTSAAIESATGHRRHSEGGQHG
jgi:hypothetical protein